MDASTGGEEPYLDGVLERPWQHVATAVRAANGNKAEDFLVAGRATAAIPLIEHKLITVYVEYLVRGACILGLKRNATRNDFGALAREVHHHIRVHLRIDVAAIEATLATAYSQLDPGKTVTPGEFAVFGTAFVGAYLCDLEKDLATLKEGLNRWLPNNREAVGLRIEIA